MSVISKDRYAAINAILNQASELYYKFGSSTLSDEQFDALSELVKYETLGFKDTSPRKKHFKQLYSLNKYYAGEGKNPLMEYSGRKIETVKLDGAAISLWYKDTILIQALTRGDGVEGEDITNKVYSGVIRGIPIFLKDCPSDLQVSGEVVAPCSIQNSRNYVSGALNLNSLEEFSTRNLRFIAYDASPEAMQYDITLSNLRSLGFDTVDQSDWLEYPQDGRVIRVNSTKDYNTLGFTSKHPRGAYALKTRKEGKVTVLREVIWQTGKSGKVTPVALFDPVELGGANITRATLNNVSFIKAMDLHIGDTIEIQRMGDIIPGVVRKITD